MKKLLLALLLCIPLVASSSKNISPPSDMLLQVVPFNLGCFETYKRMESFLKEEWGESPRYHMMFRADRGTDGWIFTNDDNTTISIVIRKFFPEEGEDEQIACIIWSGENVDGQVFTPL